MLVVWFFLPVVPDVLGSTPTGNSYDDHEWIQPLLSAGFCVDFVYEPDKTSFEKDGHFTAISDTYLISGVSPSPGSRALPGSTVTVTVGGSPMVGPYYDWDAVPAICPS